MHIIDTMFKDVKILSFDSKKDIRGNMVVTIDNYDMDREGINFECKEQRIYYIQKKGTFFGIHFQSKNYPQDKLVYLLTGRGLDYVVDLKKESSTYKKWIAIELRGDDNQHIYIPQGYGHAFLALEDNTAQLFSINKSFFAGETKQIRYNDKQINLDFPIEITAISDYDKNAPYLDDIESSL